MRLPRVRLAIGIRAPDWTELLFRARAPYLFEPVLAVHPLPQLTVLVSPLNLVLGAARVSAPGHVGFNSPGKR